jgi:2-dehydro-3-deoxygluconokinase
MADVICFGEVMLRLTTPGFQRFEDARYLDLCFGGAEANVAVQLAQLGWSVGYVSRLPANDIADRCLAELRGRGVDTLRVLRGGERMGIYFVEPGASQRPTRITYDRRSSAFSEMEPGMFDWDAVFNGARWFHWSGITPALSEGCAALCREACDAAQRRGMTVSFDLNFRRKLWTPERAAQVLQPLMRGVDLCVCGEDEAVSVLGADSMDDDEEARVPALAASLARKHGFKTVAMTSRSAANASRTMLRAMLYTGGGPHFSGKYEIDVVDRIGAGDAFTGGLLFSLLRGDMPESAVEFAAATGAWKHSVPGDWNRVSVEEVEALASGEGGGRVLR